MSTLNLHPQKHVVGSQQLFWSEKQANYKQKEQKHSFHDYQSGLGF